MRIVIIGNGVAGMEAAMIVRRGQPDWEIIVISEESDHFFSRTALMWVLSGQMSHRDIEPLERDAYERLGLQRIRARAVGIDVSGRRVRLAGGLDPVPYDRLLIASGSRPRPGPWPGSDVRGVGHFVTHQDLAWLESEVHGGVSFGGGPPRPEQHLRASAADSPYRFREVAARARGRQAREIAVIGGGLVGIEAVEIAVAAGLSPRFFIREEWFWPIALDARESRWIAERMTAHGVEVHLAHDVEELETDAAGNVSAVRTNHGRYETDCVVIAIGVTPNTSWLSDSAIALDARGGIVVDDGLSTSATDVFAAGDCASVRWFDGSRRPEQLWYTARDQGRIAGRRLLGAAARYQRGPWYNSAKLMDIEYTTAGLVNQRLDGEDSWYFEEQGRVRSTTRVVHQGDRVVGFNMLGRRWDHNVLIRWIEEQRSPDWVVRNLQQASFDTELVPPLRVPRA